MCAISSLKSSRLLSHLLMSSCHAFAAPCSRENVTNYVAGTLACGLGLYGMNVYVYALYS